MSVPQYINSVPIFQGAQGKFYLLDGQKYHIRFPIEWAHDHTTFITSPDCEEPSGPECRNCDVYGSIRGVFVGYCGNCLVNYASSGRSRGRLIAPGLPVDMLENKDLWTQYPYLYGVSKSEIGDEENANVTDDGVNLESLEKLICASIEEDKTDRTFRQSAFCESMRDECIEISEEELDEISKEIFREILMDRGKVYQEALKKGFPDEIRSSRWAPYAQYKDL
jgi:hypothetical protein